jgi:tetratricopeptide (TPR) repeat protein
MVENDFNQITIDNKIYKKEICCDDIELIEKLKESGKLNPNLENNEYIINCTKENKYVIDPIHIGKGGSSFVYNLIGQHNKVIRVSKTDCDDIIDEIQGLFIQYYISKKCPYICKVYEFGYLTINNEKRVYAILEKLVEPDLTGINFEETPQKYDYKTLMEQIFDGMLCIHNNNFIHADIFISNIGIGEDKNARIFDFGGACYFDITINELKILKDKMKFKMKIPDSGSYEIVLKTLMNNDNSQIKYYIKDVKTLMNNTLKIINNISGFYYKIGIDAETHPMYEECIVILKQVIGNDNLDTLIKMNNLASLYNMYKVIPLYEECLEKRKQLLGNDHPDTLQLMFILTWFYNDIGEKDKALALFEECLEKRKQLLGNDHPDTVKVANNLACFYDDIGERDKAINLRNDYIL